MPLVATRGAASAQGFGEFAQSGPANYIEEVFSTYLYTGNDSVQTITNGIDLAGKGGLIWLKKRNNTSIHGLWDTARGGGSRLDTSSTAAPGSVSPAVTFNSNGFTLPAGGSSYLNESSTNTYVSWTFREQPKFFDVVTYTGTGSSRTVAHNLGSVPGCIVVKRTDAAADWQVYHRSLSFSGGTAQQSRIVLNTTAAVAEATLGYWDGTAPTSTVFSLGGDNSINASGGTYVAYLFAHDAGGFGLSGSDNVISCGSFTTDGSGLATVSLGYEPQWILAKKSSGTADSWLMVDNMRGFVSGPAVNTSDDARLVPNLSNAEAINDFGRPTATGFEFNVGVTNADYIYIAIRRGPMKTPTSGTSVFSPNTTSNDSAATTINFPLDMLIEFVRAGNANNSLMTARLVGSGLSNRTALTNGDFNSGTRFTNSSTAVTPDVYGSGVNVGLLSFRRAPGFFDVVCYTGTGSNTTQTHNLGVVPEMMIFKRRDTAANWRVYHSSQPASDLGILNSTSFFQTDTNVLNSTAPTASVFTVGTNAQTNASGGTYVAYLFATVAGVSKVGSYTGTGTTKQIDCGFTGGARFVLIKRVDDSGDWYVWDSARGIVAGNDPYLLLNSTAAEVTNTDYVDTYSAGFEISSTAPAAINANGGTFIFLAIA